MDRHPIPLPLALASLTERQRANLMHAYALNHALNPAWTLGDQLRTAHDSAARKHAASVGAAEALLAHFRPLSPAGLPPARVTLGPVLGADLDPPHTGPDKALRDGLRAARAERRAEERRLIARDAYLAELDRPWADPGHDVMADVVSWGDDVYAQPDDA